VREREEAIEQAQDLRMARTRVGGVHEIVGKGEAGVRGPTSAPLATRGQSEPTEIVLKSTNLTTGDKTNESFIVPCAVARSSA
jgi:hypothetical protein